MYFKSLASSPHPYSGLLEEWGRAVKGGESGEREGEAKREIFKKGRKLGSKLSPTVSHTTLRLNYR